MEPEMGLIQRLTGSAHIHDDIGDRFRRYFSVARILDLPAGDGVNSRRLITAGFSVRAADLFPKNCHGEGFTCDCVDMTLTLPYEDNCFDGILCSEGIEHIDNQIFLLRELYRILKPGGILIVTTPNILNLEGRLGLLLSGHAHRRRAMVISTAAIRAESTPDESAGDSIYFGHIFLINIYQLRFYLTHVGFEVLRVDSARYSLRSLLLAPLLYIPVNWATRKHLRHRRSKATPELRRKILSEVLGGPMLFGRKLIMDARKPAN
jgi:SAM-dependent methyltransferase